MLHTTHLTRLKKASGDLPVAGGSVDGLRVGDNIPNQASIAASFDDYEILSRIRIVPMSAFDSDPKDLFYAANDFQRVNDLAEAIKRNGWLDPLIVVQDPEGYYVLEGGHRLGALHVLGKTEFPALVVKDLS